MHLRRWFLLLRCDHIILWLNFTAFIVKVSFYLVRGGRMLVSYELNVQQQEVSVLGHCLRISLGLPMMHGIGATHSSRFIQLK